MPCVTPIPLDVAAYSKLLILRQGLILQPRSPQSVPQTGPLEAIEEWSGQQRAGEWLEGEGQPVPYPPPEASLHISCTLRGIIWVRMIGKAQQMHELSMSIFTLCHRSFALNIQVEHSWFIRLFAICSN